MPALIGSSCSTSIHYRSISPGEDNYLPLTHALINEVLSHTDPPLEDAVELYNPNSTNLDIGGWFLSNQSDNLKRYQIPPGTFIPAQGYVVLYEYQFCNPTDFTFNTAHGDKVYLSTGDATGNLTGFRAKTSFGPAANGVSFGRFVTSVGTEFVAMSQLTLGSIVKPTDPPEQIDLFRSGKGASNSYPRVGSVVIAEIMYHPPAWDGTSTDNLTDEFIELHNSTSNHGSLAMNLPTGPPPHPIPAAATPIKMACRIFGKWPITSIPTPPTMQYGTPTRTA